MFKHFKKNALIIFLLLSIFTSFFINNTSIVSAEDNNVNLVLDTKNINNLPNNFRTTSDLERLKNLSNINMKGLDTLNISGSQQFAPNNLSLLVTSTKTNLPITVVDLRQESHGFINEYPVSWKGAKNDANLGLTREDVIDTEINLLNSITLGTPIQFFNNSKLTVIPEKVLSENQLIKANSMDYIRIPVTDGKLPTYEMVDFFVQYVNSIPKESWLHFHCKEGIGRTTTFMIMYDIMKNYNNATLDEIINRQLALSGIKEKSILSFPSKERLDFFTKFYEYVKEQNNDFKISWSQWLNKNNFPLATIR
ncbi:fused DSP-PTPase phosphatase/NAD kinase-like protein [Clostridium perfringens]|uniref:fused DSP-PTPase phosphatase/NAD kinase-like protein n=1 Tax=Clostridium perfringens TaxID=1502 RepID=UPI0029108749|nr:phytase [Clostridium perfringens]EHA0994140.1 phytase [Clostridium perfringens]EHA1184975.1 phytase [Clostridium perfringens]EJT6143310.1 phytase [Clostridium perfringens]MDK0898288.1 phytase [Clostridium perfringens]